MVHQRMYSFNDYGGLYSTHSFDNFYGSDNSHFSANSVTVIKEATLVCHIANIPII